MTDIRKLDGTREDFPTHDEIERCAYGLYLRRLGEGHAHSHTAVDDWLTAEEQLRQERANKTPVAPLKSESALQRERAKSASTL